MAHSNKDSIEIKDAVAMDGRKPLAVKELWIDGGKRAAVEQRRNGSVNFRFYPAGSFNIQEARVWILGLLELSIHAEALENEKK